MFVIVISGSYLLYQTPISHYVCFSCPMLTRPSEVAGQIPSVPGAVATKLFSHLIHIVVFAQALFQMVKNMIVLIMQRYLLHMPQQLPTGTMFLFS